MERALPSLTQGCSDLDRRLQPPRRDDAETGLELHPRQPIYRIDDRHTGVQCVRFLLRVDRTPDQTLKLHTITDNLRHSRSPQGAEWLTLH